MGKEAQNIKFGLSRISTEQFAIIDDNFSSSKGIHLKTNLRYGADGSSKMISCFVEIVFESENKPFLKVEGGCHFSIGDKSWDELKDENSVNLPKGFVRHLAVLTVGTVRGILHTKTEGTDFNKYVLPTVDITAIIKEDAVLKIN